jgi:ParB-like chromosome segregation protein Spo0J
MIRPEVPLSSIDFSDETYRISEDLQLERMIHSLEAAGQVHPVVLIRQTPQSPCTIVCGFRRLHALRRMGRRDAAAGLLNAEELTTLDVCLLAVWDNLSHRQFTALESARVLETLQKKCGVGQQALVDRFLPLLGLQAHRSVLDSYLRLNVLLPELRGMLNSGRLTVASAGRLARLPHEEQSAIASVFGRIQLSASLQREVLDLAEDIAAASDLRPAAVIHDPEIAALASDAGLSPFQRGEKIHALLYRRRHPRYSNARDAFAAARAALDLPGTIRISHDPFFERPRLRVEFDVDSAQDFRDTAAALGRACEASSLDRLFQI